MMILLQSVLVLNQKGHTTATSISSRYICMTKRVSDMSDNNNDYNVLDISKSSTPGPKKYRVQLQQKLISQ